MYHNKNPQLDPMQPKKKKKCLSESLVYTRHLGITLLVLWEYLLCPQSQPLLASFRDGG